VCSGLATKEDEKVDEPDDAGSVANTGGSEEDSGGSEDGGAGDTATLMWGVIGAIVGVGACGILAYLYINGCGSKADKDAADEDVKTYRTP